MENKPRYIPEPPALPGNDSQKKSGNTDWSTVTIGGVTGILLGGAAMFGAQELHAQETPAPENGAQGESAAEISSSVAESLYAETAAAETPAPEAHAAHTAHAASSPSLISLIDMGMEVSDDVNDNMSFGEAFATARAEVGSGGAFIWRGGIYSTHYAEEWKAMTPQEHAEFNSHFAWTREFRETHNVDPTRAASSYETAQAAAPERERSDEDLYSQRRPRSADDRDDIARNEATRSEAPEVIDAPEPQGNVPEPDSDEIEVDDNMYDAEVSDGYYASAQVYPEQESEIVTPEEGTEIMDSIADEEISPELQDSDEVEVLGIEDAPEEIYIDAIPDSGESVIVDIDSCYDEPAPDYYADGAFIDDSQDIIADDDADMTDGF